MKEDELARLQCLIVEQAPDAIMFADADGIILLWNQGAERIFGVPAAEALGRSLDLIIPERMRLRHWEGWQRVVRTGESRYRSELLRVPALRQDGGQFSAEFSIVMLKDGKGAVAGFAAILRDVTAQWEREKALQAKVGELNAAIALKQE